MNSAGKANVLLRALDVGVAPLRGGHRPRVEPCVDHRRDARRRRRARRAREGDLVDGGPVRVDAGHVGAGELGELGARADARDVTLLAAPDRQRRAPVAVARERPVDVVREPLAEPAVADVLGVPVDRLRSRAACRPCGAWWPRTSSACPSRGGRRCTASSAGPSACASSARCSTPRRSSSADDVLVRVPHGLALEPRDRRGEPAVLADGVERREAELPADLTVDLAERGGEVHDAGPVLDRHVVGGHHDTGVAVDDLDVGRTGAGSAVPRARSPERSRRRPRPRRRPPRRGPRPRSSRRRRRR